MSGREMTPWGPHTHTHLYIVIYIGVCVSLPLVNTCIVDILGSEAETFGTFAPLRMRP